MKKQLLVLIWIALCFIGSSCLAAAESKPIVGVVDFTNNSGKPLRGIEKASSEILSTLLAETGRLNVVERDKLKSIITEQGFSMSGLVDSTQSAIEVGKLLGANYLVTGAIVSYGSDVVKFKGYGISSEKVVTSMTVSVKVLDVTTGQIVFASLYSAQNSSLNMDSVYHSSDQVARTLLTDALRSAVDDLTEQISPKEETPSNQVMITFRSNPTGADVEIDNVYYGSTPLEIPINPGLHHVVISFAGYKPWAKTIRAYDGLVVNVTLEEKHTSEDEENNDGEEEAK